MVHDEHVKLSASRKGYHGSLQQDTMDLKEEDRGIGEESARERSEKKESRRLDARKA